MLLRLRGGEGRPQSLTQSLFYKWRHEAANISPEGDDFLDQA